MIGLSMTAYPGRGLLEFEKWVGRAKKLGFDFVEILSEWPHYLTGDSYRLFAEVLDGWGMKRTVHAPFSDVNIGSFNDRLRRTSLEIIHETIELAAELDALSVTIHPGHCSPVSVKNLGKYLEIHRNSLRKISQWGVEYGIKIGVENMPRFPILDAQTCERLWEILDDVEIGVTFDVGHLNTTTRNFERFLDIFGDKIVHVHLHDNFEDKDEHLALGDGTVPWVRLIPKFPRVTWALEVKDIESARRSLEFLKSLH